MKFADFLKAGMDRNKLTAADVAKAAGMSEANVSRVLSGFTADPKLSTALLLIKAVRGPWMKLHELDLPPNPRRGFRKDAPAPTRKG